MHVESSRYTGQLPDVTSLHTMANVALGAGTPHEDTELRRELDEVRLQLLGAVDAARGAEAERAAVEARVKELEHQHHMLSVERDELRRELARLEADRRSTGVRLLKRVVRGVRRRLSGG